ncbi:carbohydrate ABC transporter permease [Herbiconiux moechotypicola]|uniref:Carbohydrate ABC transporter permease n=1 Tax=Herbiconiux moechotypicola TaxID=637393 RepID=A0ABP5R2I1_9MICO|nr:carbohydrate ABC transporter permease [Herbiconiux moechotypicola]MCS5732002.1 carbohydrate ABC transporter permease [Herbiconiux moechotypicola]
MTTFTTTATIRRRSNWLLTALLLAGSFVILVPLYLTIVTALKTPAEMRTNLWGLPTVWHWENLATAVSVTDFPRALANSAFVTILTVVLTVLSNSLVGYAIARNMHKRSFKFLFFYFVSALFIPFPIIMLPLVKQMSILHLDNLIGLVVMYVVFNLAFNVLLYTGYLQTIPKELEEAAKIDGAGVWTTYWRVIFPLLMPVNATVAILTALGTWNDFLGPLVILSDDSSYTLPLVQYAFQSQFSTNYNLAFASYLLALAPMLIIYLIAQRWIVGGIVQGALK